MGLYFDFPQGWWILLAIIYGLWFAMFVQRQSYKRRNELKIQLVYGVIMLFIAFLTELGGVTLGLWTVFPNNWPITIWLGYLGAGLLSYQILKRIEETV